MVDGERLDRTDCRPYSRYKVKRWGLVMKIGELAARAACDVQTVRYYEREGLLEAPAREASGYRRYGRAHLARLQFIRHCRSLEIPLSQVRQLVAFARSPSESWPRWTRWSMGTSRACASRWMRWRCSSAGWWRCEASAAASRGTRARSSTRSAAHRRRTPARAIARSPRGRPLRGHSLRGRAQPASPARITWWWRIASSVSALRSARVLVECIGARLAIAAASPAGGSAPL